MWPSQKYPLGDSSEGWLTDGTKLLHLLVAVQFVAITRLEMGFPEIEPELNRMVKALPET